jgi:hypothetical protein
MAELDPQPTQTDEQPAKPVVEETLVIPPNRPRKVYAGMWGPVEIGVVSAGVLALMMAFVVYFFWVRPSNNELAGNKAEADRLEAEAISANSKYGEITNTQTQVDKLVGSIDDFESNFLPVQTYGQTALYQRLNTLIHSYGLENTNGPAYAPLESADLSRNNGQQTDEEKGRAKFRSLYPGVYVSTTLEGSYQNLRRFIREIETGRDFVVISAIELAPSETEKKESEQPNDGPKQVNQIAAAPGGKPLAQPPNAGFQPGQVVQNLRPAPKGKTHGETVALHIEMAAYFRRPNFQPMSTGSVQQ